MSNDEEFDVAMILSDLDTRLLSSALSFGREAEGSCYPNPAVGCVIALGAEIIGFGATGASGVPHAERGAISMARAQGGRMGVDMRATSLYVTLEPCAHMGKTPPCVEAIIESGIGRVVYGFRDPDSRTNGKGRARLVSAGLDVIEADRESEIGIEIAEFFRGHCSRVKRGRPFCTLKLAISLDGKISASSLASSSANSSYAPSPESRTFISGEVARFLRNDLLRRTDAILIGAGTARSDNPRLLLDGYDDERRDERRDNELQDDERDFAPLRVLVDGRLTVALESRLVQTLERAPLLIITRQGEVLSDKGKALSNSGVRFMAVPARLLQGGAVSLSLRSALEGLAELGVASLLCEGGARLAHSLCREGLVDRLILFCANRVLGSEGLSMLEGREGLAQDFVFENETQLGTKLETKSGTKSGIEPDSELAFDRIVTLRPRAVSP